MKLILDNNIFFSLMKPDSTASKLLYDFNFELVAPDFIKHEFDKYKKEILKKSRLSKKDFDERLKFFKSRINFIEFESYKKFLKKSFSLISDKKDSPYLAVALLLKCPIWSNNGHFKEQDLVPVFTTRELIEILS